MDANCVACGTSSTQGEDTSIGKNNAPVSLTVRKTSDKTSTLPDSCADTGGDRLTAGESARPVRILDARADNADDPSWRLFTPRSYIRGVSTGERDDLPSLFL